MLFSAGLDFYMASLQPQLLVGLQQAQLDHRMCLLMNDTGKCCSGESKSCAEA